MMNNVLAVVCILGLLTAILGAIFLAIWLAKVHLGEKRGNVKKYLALPPIAIFVIGFVVWVVTFFIAA